ncbi:hypothetical protein BU26DRAFT_518532 [Trematosphaeria pertusa]|uniref:Uncharacterized protein n=1 Tax=Trematosphaeria pertusa TaxID=390896 RepID=A0A6A6IIN9_9PLEO|nr:uncharacterized protein BU26DRAFT_518532 [Trematosphaeria pertusa]KAF2250079.1 hypothetical protein BU26DRAFT_518532 [Trematosphaeria pertusa]
MYRTGAEIWPIGLQGEASGVDFKVAHEVHDTNVDDVMYRLEFKKDSTTNAVFLHLTTVTLGAPSSSDATARDISTQIRILQEAKEKLQTEAASYAALALASTPLQPEQAKQALEERKPITQSIASLNLQISALTLQEHELEKNAKLQSRLEHMAAKHKTEIKQLQDEKAAVEKRVLDMREEHLRQVAHMRQQHERAMDRVKSEKKETNKRLEALEGVVGLDMLRS